MLVEFADRVDRHKLEELSRKFQRSKASVPTRCVCEGGGGGAASGAWALAGQCSRSAAERASRRS